jgi:hypothetical protein
MDKEMKLEVEAFLETLNTGREDLVSADELDEFSLAPGASASNGHGCCCSSGMVDVE